MKKGDLIWFNSANSKARAIVLEAVVLEGHHYGVNKSMFAHGDLAVRLFWLDPDEIKPSCYNLVKDPNHPSGYELTSAWVPKANAHKNKWYNARWFKMLSRS